MRHSVDALILNRLFMTTDFSMTGLVPAAYTPMNADFSVNYDAIGKMAEYLHKVGTPQIFICGSTGEGCMNFFDGA